MYGACRGACGGRWSTSGCPSPAGLPTSSQSPAFFFLCDLSLFLLLSVHQWLITEEGPGWLFCICCVSDLLRYSRIFPGCFCSPFILQRPSAFIICTGGATGDVNSSGTVRVLVLSYSYLFFQKIKI